MKRDTFVRNYWRRRWLAAKANMPKQHRAITDLLTQLGYSTHSPAGYNHASNTFFHAVVRGSKPRNEKTAKKLKKLAGLVDDSQPVRFWYHLW